MIKAILACDESGGVSKNGTIPWPKNLKDLKWFKKNTSNNIVVMGSKTWDDPLMPWPLPNRTNVLATNRKKNFPLADTHISGNLCEAILEISNQNKDKIVWIIGGPNIIDQTLNIVEEFYLSRIPGSYECDGFLSLKKIEQLFKKRWSEKHSTVEFQIWEKR